MSLDRDHKIAIAERVAGLISAVPAEGGPTRTLEEILVHVDLGKEIDPDENVRRRAIEMVDNSEADDEEWLQIERIVTARTVEELVDPNIERGGREFN